MSTHEPLGIDRDSPPFDQYKSVRWLAPARSGHASHEHVRHQLYAARAKQNPVNVLIKVVSKPGIVYEADLANEISTLSAINRALPDSRHFPFVYDHGHLDDGRAYLIMSLFDEFPLATIVGTERVPARLVAHLRTAIEVARALAEIHDLEIFHVDLNPMNILQKIERGRPVIRLVDFESSYERSRHSAGVLYNPPTTPGYTAPEVTRQAPDARADVFSLGAVLHALVAGTLWVAQEDLRRRITADRALDADLRAAVLTAVDLDPARRYPTIGAFQAALAAYLEQIWPGRT